MDFAQIRRLTIVALFSDDRLADQLVLKGGNALSLVYRVSPRTSLDLDFSLEGDFPDFEEARKRLFRALRDRFDSAGYAVFDEQLEPKPRLEGEDERPWWGGYELKFKLVEKAKFQALQNHPRKLQIDALVVGPRQQRTFTVEFSKYEHTAGKVERELDYYTIYVYTPEMIVAEKLRAICQQMPAYPLRGHRRARARDFYDIHRAITQLGIDLTTRENHELVQNIFAAKRVPLTLLRDVRNQREFHRPDWPDVVASVPESLQEFDFYFDFVVGQIGRLKSLGDEEAPP